VALDGTGPKTAFHIAQWFDGWEDYRDAYEAVDGIGPNKGRALARRH